MLKRLLLIAAALAALSSPAFAAKQIADIACMDTTTAGTGTLTLSGATAGGYLSFAAAGVTDGSTVPYQISNGSASLRKLETGQGVYSAGTLTRVPEWSSSGAATALTLSGTSTVCIGPISSNYASGNQLVFGAASLVNYLTLANATTGNSPTFTAAGADANIGMSFVTKGGKAPAILFDTGSSDTSAVKWTTTSTSGVGLVFNMNDNAQVCNFCDNVQLNFSALNSIGTTFAYGYIASGNEVRTAGAETGYMVFGTFKSGAANTRLQIEGGVEIGAGCGTDPGAGNLCFTTSGQGIYDTNAKPELLFTATASAVNYLTFANAATTGDPILQAAGTDANINLDIYGKNRGGVRMGALALDNIGIGMFGYSGPYTSLIIGNITGGNFANGGEYAIARLTKTNSPFTAISGWDNGSSTAIYYGGGGWGSPDATVHFFYAASAYPNNTNDTATKQASIGQGVIIGTGSSFPGAGNLLLSTAGSYVQTTPTVVASLPTCVAGLKGARAFVTDANSVVFHATAVGLGANNMGVVCDGTNWYLD